MRCAKRVIIMLWFAAAAARGQQTWTTGTFTYDGAGNITAMGTDSYLYDSAGRLVKGTVGGPANVQQYSYDAVNNRVDAATVSTATNRVTNHNALYDAAGNTTALDGVNFSYDGAGMARRQTATGIDWQFIYTADDERLATYTGGGNWQFTVRDLRKL